MLGGDLHSRHLPPCDHWTYFLGKLCVYSLGMFLGIWLLAAWLDVPNLIADLIILTNSSSKHEWMFGGSLRVSIIYLLTYPAMMISVCRKNNPTDIQNQNKQVQVQISHWSEHGDMVFHLDPWEWLKSRKTVYDTVDVWNPAITSWGNGSLSRYLQGFIHPRWFSRRISSINSNPPDGCRL